MMSASRDALLSIPNNHSKGPKETTTFVHDKIMSLCHRLRYNYCKAIKMNSNFRVATLFTKVFRSELSELLYQDTAM